MPSRGLTKGFLSAGLFWTVDLSLPVRQVEIGDREKNRSVVVPCKKLASQ
jgi:hypothetical protein